MKDITNKLIHYDTRKAFEKDRSRIPFTSIVFIDEDRTIYTHGTEYNSSDVAKRIDQIDQDLIDMLNKSHQDLLDLINELSKYVEDMYKKDVTGWQDKYEELKDKVDKMMKQLAAFINDKDNLRISIDDLQARIELVAKYWDEAQGVFSSIQAEINAMKGTIRIQGEYWDNLNSMFNSFKQEVNLQLGTFKTMLESLDIEGKVRTILGREMDGPGGIIYDYVKRIKDGVTSSVETWLDVNIPGWKTLVSRIEALEGVDPTQGLSNILAGFEARISEIETGFASITRQWSEWQRTHGDGTVDMTALAEIRTQIREINGKLEVLTQQVSKLTPGNPTESGWEEAIASITTRVEELENGVSAMTQQISQIRTENAEAIASVNTQVELINGKLTSLASIVATWVPNANVDVDDLEERISKLEVWANSDENGFNLSAVWNKMTAEGKKQFVASIVGIVNDTGESTIKINADKIDLNGKTVFLNAMRTVVSGWLTNDPDFPHPWSNGGSGGTSSGTTDSDLANRLAALERWTSDRFYLTGSGVIFDSTSGNQNRVELSTDLGLRHTDTTNSSRHGYILNNNGTGSVAFGKISWDASGNLTIGGYSTTAEVRNMIDAITNTGTEGPLTDTQVRAIITTELTQHTNEIDGKLNDYLKTSDADSTIKGVVSKTYLESKLNLENDLATDLATFKSGITRLNGAVYDSNNNVKFVTMQQVDSEFNNLMNNETAWSGLKTWAAGNAVGTSAGFSLGALIKSVGGNVNGGDLIVGEINNAGSNVKISASKVDIDTSNLSVTADKISIGNKRLSNILELGSSGNLHINGGSSNASFEEAGMYIETFAEDAGVTIYHNGGTNKRSYFSPTELRMNMDSTGNGGILYDSEGIKKLDSNSVETAFISFSSNGNVIIGGDNSSATMTLANEACKFAVSKGSGTNAKPYFLFGNTKMQSVGDVVLEYSNLVIQDHTKDSICHIGVDELSYSKNASFWGTMRISGAVTCDSTLTASSVTQSSDIRLKDIVEEIEPDINDIAAARIIKYTKKDDKNEQKQVRVGSIAQDWLNILPESVFEGADGYYTLNYSEIALISAVEAAREIVKLKEENASLKAQIAKIIEKIGGID